MAVHAELRRVVLTLSIFLTASAGATAAGQLDQREVKEALKRWAYPNAKPSEVVHTTATTSGISTATSGIYCDIAQYSTADPFHEVVRFYVQRSGFEPPNWKILGRKSPGDTVNMPASWSKLGETEAVTVLHHIRQDSAIAGVLVTDFSSGVSVSVSISRGLKDDRTFIQVARQARKGAIVVPPGLQPSPNRPKAKDTPTDFDRRGGPVQ